jgi:ABC-2 type transport system permease protein
MKSGGDIYNNGQEPIQVGDITVTSDNPFYWQLSNIMSEQQYVQVDGGMITTPEALDLVLELLDAELNYYAQFAANVTTYQDYRYELAYTGTSALYDQFVLSRVDSVDHDVLREAGNYRLYLDQVTFDAKYYDISATERLAALDKAEEKLNQVFDIVANNNFSGYIDLMIAQQNDQITSLQAQIEVYEETLREHPEQEESLNANIESCQKQITVIQETTIPLLEYRREKNIIPYSGMWQDTALNDITNAQNQLQYFTIMTEEQFNQDTWSAMQYGTYANYVSIMEKQKADLNNTVLIAQNCLDTDKPDMKYVPSGARFITMNFLGYSVVIAIFAVLLGGWLIACEFQFGTIRLLMIRPRTRTKILMSKF